MKFENGCGLIITLIIHVCTVQDLEPVAMTMCCSANLSCVSHRHNQRRNAGACMVEQSPFCQKEDLVTIGPENLVNMLTNGLPL